MTDLLPMSQNAMPMTTASPFLDHRSFVAPNVTWGDIERALSDVRVSSYDEGYKDGHAAGYTFGLDEGWRRGIESLHKATARVETPPLVLAKAVSPEITRFLFSSPADLKLLDESIITKDVAQHDHNPHNTPDWLHKELHHNPVSKHADKSSIAARRHHDTDKDAYHAHKQARLASRMAAAHHHEMARMAHGMGQKDRALHHEAAAGYHESVARFHGEKRREHAEGAGVKTPKRKGLIHRLIRRGIEPSSQEAVGVVCKALRKRQRRSEWISAKIGIIMKDGIRGRQVSQAQAVAVAHKLWKKKANRLRPPAEAKAIDVVWLLTAGIAVNASELQYKDTDGSESGDGTPDGLNEQRRSEDMGKEFDPMVVPPIAVWRATEDDQIYVVDGHKRLATAKRKGVPNVRAFFIEATSFEDAKKKGERLNERMGTKAFDESKHPRGAKGTSTGGQFTKGSGGSYSHTALIRDVRENHAAELAAPSHESGSDKDVKRPPTTDKKAYVNRAQYMVLRQRAVNKIRHVANHPLHKPTKQEVRENRKKIREKGANTARRDLNGNNIQRRERKVALAKEFGDGKTCGCPYCGVIISFSRKYSKRTMEEDKIHDTANGGRYRLGNIIPACVPCNRSRGDTDALTFLQQSTYGQKGK